MEKVTYDYLVIGGGIAGVTAAEAIRTRVPDKKIAILSAEAQSLYSRVLLPAYLKNKIPRERVFLRTAEDFTKKSIDFYPKAEAVRVDTERHAVEVKDGRVFGFERLLVACGGTVRQWSHAADTRRVYRLQTMDDADILHRDMSVIRAPLVIGSSFIALEFIEIFLQNGITPQVLVRDDRFFPAFLDTALGDVVASALKDRGVACVFGDEVREVISRDAGYEIISAHDRRMTADAIALGIGVRRNISFLEGSGIELGERGVKTNERFETNVAGIWAAGDVAEYFDPVSGDFRITGNWTHAVLEGTRAGLNMAGDSAPFTSVPAYAISCLGMHLALVGAISDEAITRADQAGGRFGRFFFQDGMLTGAFLINRARDKPYFADLIARRARLATFEQDSIWKM
ncbi:MAG: hypothetical protein A3J58_03360 [Candidatus Sungbacteria bacterium RIFCSPHIGHO2_02_FULL_52_23]|uniref:FAD/NAD(P)-binding domain-containing protein n=1 Tax=Candidatus Sungbacteria bacterium RIFCSPHIGHO2_02_FULL_52_23 TaxID=1802274 RepID=A0A1G2KZW7_9BACT|nr:MAG: hypothetical protein A3J58_03360 [Candidatus Sungbacteria bacterium RIFCSPHIGHO2_02_FULL_52_23]